jgi:hypothetical protein
MCIQTEYVYKQSIYVYKQSIYTYTVYIHSVYIYICTLFCHETIQTDQLIGLGWELGVSKISSM